MPVNSTLEELLRSHVEERRDRLVEIIRDLVRIPSENTPPTGNEEACQRYASDFLRKLHLSPTLYDLREVPALESHPIFWPGRDYRDRPNLGARRKGRGGGRSLLLSGHIDTVPRGTLPWTRDPFGGEVVDNRLYGRGSNDMKGGVGTNLFIFEALYELGIELAGDLVFETVVDEEFGGVNGTLAGRLKGFNAEAAVISEPSSLRVCPAQRGGRTAHVKLSAMGGVLTEGAFPAGVISQLHHLLHHLDSFAEQRRVRAAVHELYAGSADPVPVSVTKVFTGPWGTKEPITIPETCLVEVYWQMMPGEKQEDIEGEFFAWLDSVVAAAPQLFRFGRRSNSR